MVRYCTYLTLRSKYFFPLAPSLSLLPSHSYSPLSGFANISARAREPSVGLCLMISYADGGGLGLELGLAASGGGRPACIVVCEKYSLVVNSFWMKDCGNLKRHTGHVPL